MITGFNTDVKFNDKVYHVQTEDRGAENPILESLVYVAGQILDSVQMSYSERFDSDPDRDALARLLEDQHKRVIRSIKNGKYDPEGVKPFGHGIISDLRFDEVVLEFLEKEAGQEKIELAVEELGDLAPGWTGALRVTVRTDKLNRPQKDCPVRITIDKVEAKRPLFKGETDGAGQLLAELTLPDQPVNGELVVVVETHDGPLEARVPFGPRS